MKRPRTTKSNGPLGERHVHEQLAPVEDRPPSEAWEHTHHRRARPITVFAPMAMARIPTTVALVPGERPAWRSAKRRSWWKFANHRTLRDGLWPCMRLRLACR